MPIFVINTTLSGAVGQGLVDYRVFMKRAEVEKTKALQGEALRNFYINYV